MGLVGLGKMGISHCAILNAHPDVELVGVCDSSGFARSVLAKSTQLRTFADVGKLLDEPGLDAAVIATPSSSHVPLVRSCLERGVSVFCEKPLTLDAADAARLTALGRSANVVTQVGYHNRFVGPFAEVKRLLSASAIGEVTHVLAEAYGPVVLRTKGGTWRSQKAEGGGCLYDYAAHVINLVTWYLGEPSEVRGTALNKVFSREIDDEVAGTLIYDDGATAQVSAHWCDESQRKMTTRITLWGTRGRIFADRQECQVYLRQNAPHVDGYRPGWNVRYITELTPPVGFYLRGEEYSAQIDHFVRRVTDRSIAPVNDFASASETDRVIDMMLQDVSRSTSSELSPGSADNACNERRRRPRFWRRRS